MKFLEILTAIMGIAMSASYFPQAYLIFKNKSSKNVSLITYLIFGFGTPIWFAYGLLTMNWVVIWGFGAGVVGSWLVISLCIAYRNK
ncbi:MAG TPA: SemiSWEET family transporter [Candidatus Paceibacterota bacterium]|nr:SemiSWEET family transporter [Candidatus Paceibacterota bacterium]